MDCTQFKEIYHELDRPGTSGYRFRERALSHAEACPRCGVLLTEGEALDFALRNLAERSAGWQASPRIEANLLRELQQVKLAGSRQRIRKQFAILGAAAAVLLALGIGHKRVAALGVLKHQLRLRPFTRGEEGYVLRHQPRGLVELREGIFQTLVSVQFQAASICVPGCLAISF